MTAKVIDGRKIAEVIRKNVLKEVDQSKLRYKTTPNITTIKVGTDSSSDLYITEGTFKVVPFFISRKGRFKAKMDEGLRVINLKLSEEEL